MAELLLHAKTKKHFDQLIKKPAQALLIYGPAGSGKRALAELIAAALLDIKLEKLSDYPYFMLVQKPANKQEISIDSVREIIRRLTLKAVIGSQKPVTRVVLIDEAHLASAEAQNALLKAIEEPPAGTIFILTALSVSTVLPTIASRAEKLPVTPIGLAESREFFADSFDNEAIDSAWQLSGGAAGLLNALLRDDQGHPLKQSVETAKRILAQSRYERMLSLDSLSSDKANFKDVLDALGRILASLHRAAVNSSNDGQAKRLLHARKQIGSAMDSLESNASPRLVALDIALRLPV